jgi:Response regulator containing CheY-like receiver, AAA-type ATPase, and DNA-binding domains
MGCRKIMTDKKILIVDYDNKSLEDLAHLFLPHKLQIIKANNGQMAYEKFQTEKPDLVILEAMLPKLHGFELAQRINKETRGAIPVIVVTGIYKGDQYRNEAIRSHGAADFFEKPFDNEKLLNSVMNLLQDEIDIGVELPSPDAVIDSITQLLEERAAKSKKKTS